MAPPSTYGNVTRLPITRWDDAGKACHVFVPAGPQMCHAGPEHSRHVTCQERCTNVRNPKVVIDPEVPERVRRQLQLAPPQALIRFATPTPSVTQHQRRWPRRAKSADTVQAKNWSVRIENRWNRRTSRPEIIGVPQAYMRVASIYHRRYVVPSLDFDQEAGKVWERTVSAVEKITHSDVVRLRLIDSVQVAAVLPYHWWEIAERLAHLSGLRANHRDILRGIKADDPDVAAVLEPQRRVHQLAIEDIKQRLRALEVFASSVSEADAARRREEAVRRLAELNDSHRDLVASLGHSGSQMETTKQVAQEVQAVIDQANEAVRQANEAGRSLVLPSNG